MRSKKVNLSRFLWVGLLGVSLVSCGQETLTQGKLAEFGLDQKELDVTIIPNWATELEIQQRELVGPPQVSRANQPPSGDFRLPAEYEPTQAVVMTWTSYTSLLGDIAEKVAQAGAEVWAVGGPSSIAGVPADLYQRLSFSYNTVWSRDYGPVGINQETGELGIVDTTYRHYASRRSDDAIPCQVAQFADAGCYTTDLILDGGNLMVDGRGNLFMTTRTYVWNSHLSQSEVDQRLLDYFNVHTIHRFEYAKNYSSPADGTGHIDMFVKLLSECKVLVAESDQSPFASVLDAAAQYFSDLSCNSEQTYQVYRIPGWSSSGTWYTYTNSLFVNNSVLVPWYRGADNDLAQSIYQDALPGYRVVMIPSDGPITSGGSIHCVTKEIPTAAPMGNRPPEAHAGNDMQAAAGQQVSLDGSLSSDPEGDSISYHWSQTGGPVVSLSDATVDQPSFVAPQVDSETTLTFQLIVNDGSLDSPPDMVDVVIQAISEWDLVKSATDTPVAIPDNQSDGIQSQIETGLSGVIQKLEAHVFISHTYIGDLKVSLICPSGTQVMLHNQSGGSSDDIDQTFGINACDSQPASGVFRLSVSDHAGQDIGNLEEWTLKLNTSEISNQPPIAHAGRDLQVDSGDQVMLDGSNSSDPENQSLTYRWTQILGPVVALDDPNLIQPSFVAPEVESVLELRFELVVNDGEFDSAGDSVSIKVTPPSSSEEIVLPSLDTPIDIPDNDSNGIQSRLNTQESGEILSLKVEVNIEHTYIGDLRVGLTCPSGTSSLLHNKSGGSANDIHQTFVVDACNGESVSGEWILTVSDHANLDVGSLENWTVKATIQ